MKFVRNKDQDAQCQSYTRYRDTYHISARGIGDVYGDTVYAHQRFIHALKRSKIGYALVLASVP